MAQFSKEKLSFVKELPEHVEIECPVCLNILIDPHLVSCCGHNFCGSCIERVRASNGSCPMCKEKKYQVMVNKERFRIINGLEVYCSNKEKGCQWKGELKNMPTHLNKTFRRGECQYEQVKCQNKKCQERKQRRYLGDHEDKECPQRPFQCQYCRSKGTFLSITKDHYEECSQYPVTCPNKCVSTNMPRGSLTAHVNSQCLLQPVDCVFSWAGCNDKPLRKDVHVHTADTKHMTLLAVACGQLKKENEKMKKENQKINYEIANIHKATADDLYPLLPVDVRLESEAVHFYTSACGRHMSARIVRVYVKDITNYMYFVLLAFHEGKFDKFNPKLPKIFTKFREKKIPLIEDTEATYEQLSHDILNSSTATLSQEVIKIELGKSLSNICTVTVTIYTQY